MPIPRTRPYDGHTLFSYGFRPFFLFGALYAALSILLWLPAYFGELTIATHFAPVDWHVHELLFGFLPAIITGFLFTAVPNWTGRMPLQGKMLILLVVLWANGRVAVALSAIIGWQIAMLIDGAFLVSITLVIAREIIAGRNYRNFKVLIPLTLLAIANLLELESISTAGSVGFLLIFATVNYSGFKLAKEIGGKKIISLIGFIACLVAFGVLIEQQFGSNRTGIIIALSIILVCFLIEWIYKSTESGKNKT